MSGALKIPYGVSDFRRIRNEGYYYVDKTEYIRRLEARDSFLFFVRPRRFGKSLLVDTLRRYYDIDEKANFETYFGDLAIGANPTADAPTALLDAQYEEAKKQLVRYRADKSVPTLASGTTLHQIVYQFAGVRPHRIEQICEEVLP